VYMRDHILWSYEWIVITFLEGVTGEAWLCSHAVWPFRDNYTPFTIHGWHRDDKRFLTLDNNNWSSKGSRQTNEATCHLSFPVKRSVTINIHHVHGWLLAPCHRYCLHNASMLDLYSNNALPCTVLLVCVIRSESV